MTHLWSYRGKAQEGIPAIDSRFHYLNHFDVFADIIALYNSRIYNQPYGSDDIAGSILSVWQDRWVVPEVNVIRKFLLSQYAGFCRTVLERRRF